MVEGKERYEEKKNTHAMKRMRTQHLRWSRMRHETLLSSVHQHFTFCSSPLTFEIIVYDSKQLPGPWLSRDQEFQKPLRDEGICLRFVFSHPPKCCARLRSNYDSAGSNRCRLQAGVGTTQGVNASKHLFYQTSSVVPDWLDGRPRS